MSDLALPSVLMEGFSIAVESGAPSVRLKVTGNADMEVCPVLGPFLLQLHTELCRVRASDVVVDWRELYFMNSSCLKGFITWVASITKLDCSDRYRVVFVSNPSLHWQRRSLEAIRAFAADVMEIQID